MSESPAPDSGGRRRVRRRVRVPAPEADRADRRWRRLRRGVRWVGFWGGVLLAGSVILYLALSRINLDHRPPE